MSVLGCFPFCAIVKQNDIKEALLLNLINPKIGGVLIDGSSGSAKSLAAQSIKSITDKKLIKLPLNISEDRLTGSIDIEKTMETGSVCVEKGILASVDREILFIDDVALLPDNITDILLEVLSSKQLIVEREGISYEQYCDFLLIATMDSEKNSLRKSLTDHFGMYVKAERLESPADRLEIMRVCDEYDRICEKNEKTWEEQSAQLRDLIEKARQRLNEIDISDDVLNKIVEKTTEANAEGHRADIIMKEAVKAIAAFHERTQIIDDDIDEAAYFVLPHRMRPSMAPEEEPPKPEEDESDDNENNDESQENNNENEHQSNESDSENDKDENNNENENESDNDTQSESGVSKYKNIPKTFETGEAFKVMDFSHEKDRMFRKGTGKRTQTKTESSSGRYIFPTMSRKNNDLALDATIRAAAPFQRKRKRSGMSIVIKNEDIREKVRQKKVSNLLVFVVDASGSMGAVKRMTEAKAAVLSLLKDAYVKRDKVSMVTFSGEGAEVILPPTGSTERGYKLLEEIKTGGKTPLNAGIEKGLRVIQNRLRQNPDIMPMLIIITDGRGNISIDKNKKPAEELIDIGEMVSKEKKIETMVIDIENNSLTSFGIAGKLAVAMKAKYYRLDEIKSDAIEAIVRKERAK